MTQQREQIYLAALLHDIGKFYQRADNGAGDSSIFLLPEIKKLESALCPQKNGNYSHKHVLWTAAFFHKYESVFAKLALTGSNEYKTLMEMSANHHLAEEQLENSPGKFIRLADHLSSGMDRSNEVSFLDEQQEQNWDVLKKTRMTSIFEGLGMNVKHSAQYHLPVSPMSIRGEWLPQQQFNANPDYKNLWNAFEAEFKFIQSSDFKTFSETLLNLLKKYTSSVPASTINYPDVSLYDHLRTTASIAVCLFDKSIENEGEPEEFMMIGGDFSGIQSYIYNILSKHAAKNLKGRSFYIKLLSDSIVNLLLKRLNLFESNIIYNAGGSFYILAPNTKNTRKAFDQCKSEIEEKIFNAHGTSIYVALDYVTIGKNAFLGLENQTLSDHWQNLFDKRNAKKSHRYSTVLKNHYDSFFTPGDAGGETLRDEITGEEISKKSNAKNLGDGTWVSELTWKQINLGKKLRNSEVWVISDGALDFWPQTDSINPAGLGFFYYFLTRKELESKKEELKKLANGVRITTINANHQGDCDFLNSTLQGFNNVFGYDFLGGNDFPKDADGDPLTFDKLAGDDRQEFKRIGVLRMDVDNLGLIFRSGIPKEKITFSRYAALSRNLDWFFKGYINTIWKNQFEQSVNIIYSGGDDLFIVGRWDKALEFGKKIQEEFSKYVCHNPNLSLSGGLAIVSGKYPIKKAASDSEKYEKAAKNYFFEYNTIKHEKAAITLLGLPLQWNKEFKAVETLKDKIVGLIKTDELPKSFISKIAMHYSLCNDYTRKYNEEHQTNQEFLLPPKEYWMMAYDFSRFKERLKSSNAKTFIEMVTTELVDRKINGIQINTHYHSLQLYNLATRWAELELRTEL